MIGDKLLFGIGLASLLAVSACSSYADRVAATCERLGAPRGTPHYWDCVQQQQEIDQRDRAMWGGVTATGAGMLR
jgi:hypothetical protein